MAPMAPAEQPPNNRREPGAEPMPWSATSESMTAATMREPRKAKPNVSGLAATSPLHRSLEQYLT